MHTDGTNIVEWDLAGSGDDMEGVALWPGFNPGEAQIFVAEDNGSTSEIWRYDFNSLMDITIMGSGSVNSAPDPPSYYGTSETLTAVPDSGYFFSEWSGDLTGSDNPAVLLMDYDKAVTATFLPAGISENAFSELDHAAWLFVVEPNPFSNRTQIRLSMLDAGYSKQDPFLAIYDAAGRLVKDLSSSLPHAPCAAQITWSGTNQSDRPLPSGVYFIKLSVDDRSQTKKVLLIR
jgi:hypothetical protein